MGDDGDGVRWMTYAELAKARDISTASATRLAFRRKWPRQRGNDGTARVAVPIEEAKPQGDAIPDATPDVIPDIVPDIMGDDTLSMWRERAEAAEQRIAQAEARADREAGRADRMEAENRELRSQTDQRAENLRELGAKLARAEGVAEGLKMALDARSKSGFAAWWRAMRAAVRS